ncbi:MAG: DegT/DnrJ/EryC1/StrS family aminotransferase [Planctomycetota bacterium]|nr:DegT/DnrJ/EryC1/StrS family aminotransferase [Planctomycetota bacterium]
MADIPITKPCFDANDRRAVLEPLDSGWVVQGPRVAAFENAIARFTGARCAVATTSCTTALHLALLACGIGPGDEVIVPAFTFVATANVVEHTGARPVFADIDLDTFNIDVTRIERVVTRKTKAIMPVHLFGLTADMDGVMRIARGGRLHAEQSRDRRNQCRDREGAVESSLSRRPLRVIEDAACAIGAFFRGRHAGTFGDAGCLSFHPRKSITTGEGGMVLTNKAAVAGAVRKLRDHGAEITDLARHKTGGLLLPEYNAAGYNYRMTDIQGALGCAQAAKLNWILKRKRALARRYENALGDLQEFRLPGTPAHCVHGYQSYVLLALPRQMTLPDRRELRLLHARRNGLMKSLAAHGIATRQGTHAVHCLAYYRSRYGLRPEDYPNALAADRLSLALPLYPQMTIAEQDRVIRALRECVDTSPP